MVQADLIEEISPSFLSTFSGDGHGVIYRLRDHPVEGQERVRLLLKSLGLRYELPGAKLDTSVHNPTRLTRLCGTWNRKYPETPGRPHRRARVISNPEPRVRVYTFPPLVSTASESIPTVHGLAECSAVQPATKEVGLTPHRSPNLAMPVLQQSRVGPHWEFMADRITSRL